MTQNIRAIGDTFFKKTVEASADLEDWQKLTVKKGEIYPVEHYQDAQGQHCKVLLGHDLGAWYIWKPHWHLPWTQPDVSEPELENKKDEVNAWFLVKAALAYADDAAPQCQTQMFLYIWETLSPEERQQALDLWEDKADRKQRFIDLLKPDTDDSPSPKEENDQSQEIPKAGLDLIKEFEGYARKLSNGSAQAYADPRHGWRVPTIGYGTTRYPNGKKVKKGDVISHTQAEEYLRSHVDSICRPPLEKIPTWKQMNQNQRGAIYSFAYNLGSGFYRGKNFKSITAVCDSPHRWGDQDWIAAQFVKYRNPGSSVEAGLRRRRLREAKLFCTPVSSAQIGKTPQDTLQPFSITPIPSPQPEESPLKVVATSNTILKAEPEGSQYLKPSQKVMIAKGEELGIKSYSPSSGQHLALKLVRPILAEDDETKLSHVYAYEPHVEVQGKVDGKDVKSIIKLNVPYFKQIDNDTTYHRSGYRQCNLTCCAMLADYLLKGELSRLAKTQGFKEPESVYGKTLKKYGDTIDHGAQTKALRAFGIESYYSASLSRDEWLQSLALGIPVVFGVKYKISGHICLLVGHDPIKKMWIVHDPYGTRHGSRDVYDIGVGGAFDLYSYGTMNIVADGRGRIVTAVNGKPTGLPKGL